MASSTYRKYYANNGIVAYAPEGESSDFLFVYASANAANEPNTLTLAQLFALWSAPTLRLRRGRASTVTLRSLFFCQRFDLRNLASALDVFAGSVSNLNDIWGRLSYWSVQAFNGTTQDSSFPLQGDASIVNGQVELHLDGQVPGSLDDFTISLDEANNELVLGFTSKTKCRVYFGGSAPIASNALNLVLSLTAPIGFVTGALSVSISWPTQRTQEHPLHMVGFQYQAPPDQLPLPGDTEGCPSWMAELADQIDGGNESCIISFDPRDIAQSAEWLAGGLNSRMDFGSVPLRSSFFGTKGERVLIKPGQGGCARLGFLSDLVTSDGSLNTSGSMIYHPEGIFQIINSSQLDLIAGTAGTEFFDVSPGVATQIEFVKSQPAFFADDGVVDDRTGVVTTSYLRFLDALGNPASVDFHSQPADAPLFVPGDVDLTRRRYRFGQVSSALPIFPWAGYKGTDGLSLVPFEATHLAPARRKKSARSSVRALSAQDPAVTPQGLLATFNQDGYLELFFGNSNSENLLQAEFSITVNDPGSDLFREFQESLAASQLFLVIDRPTVGCLHTIQPSAQIQIRDFNFSVNLDAASQPPGDPQDQVSVLIVKYFKDRSIASLVADDSTWACKEFLANQGNTRILTLVGDPVPDALVKIWNDPDWQGVLVVNLPIVAMPDIVESLRPGIAGNLLAHHIGLNFLPVRAADLTTTPQRLGSAFGLLQYLKNQQSPDPPTTVDHEPGGPTPDTIRTYSLIVDDLKIAFENSQVSSFAATVEVGFSHLFWDGCSIQQAFVRALETKTRSKRRKIVGIAAASGITLVGGYERRVKPDGTTEDVFSLSTNADFTVNFTNSLLKSLAVTRAQLSIVSSERSGGPSTPLTKLVAFIGIDGDILFREPLLSIPVFTIQAIHLSNFGFQLTYSPRTSTQDKQFDFALKADGISADLSFDPPSGTSSILGLLPVTLKGMTIALGQLLSLNSLGFKSIGGTSDVLHFGFVLELDLGLLGSLAGDLQGLRIPMILGWAGGASKGVSFGLQFPTFDGQIDIGIQQFIRLRADELVLKPCPDTGADIQALGIEATNAKVVMFGKEWPDAKTSIAIFIPVHPSRKASWALGITPSDGSSLKYLGGGHRISLPVDPKSTADAVTQFQLGLADASQICSVVDLKKPDADGWSVVAAFSAGIDVLLAVSDGPPAIYGLALALPVLGELDVLYRRVNDQLGIFSAEYTLPEAIRTIQMGAATVRLPTFRVEIHTDGGFLFDIGFPWNNDFSRSCQVEIAVFVGSGGFYYGRTSAAAVSLFAFAGGYGYDPPDSLQLKQLSNYRALQIGFAARVGIGRSFSIGILSADASITVFGGLEGAVAYPEGGGGLLSPTLYAFNGYVGVMLDIRASVSFAIIQAKATLLAYAMVGIEIRRVLAKQNGKQYFLTLPVVLYAEVALIVAVDVQISIGCVTITIHLSFSATWRLQVTIGSLTPDPVTLVRRKRKKLAASDSEWNPNYQYWTTTQEINLFITVLPCMANASDVGETGGPRTCVVGQMLLPILDRDNGFGDFGRFLVGWVLRPNTTNGIADDDQFTLAEIRELRAEIQTAGDGYWNGFQTALQTVVGKQFKPVLNKVTKANVDDAFASIPFWIGTTFQYSSATLPLVQARGVPSFVTEGGVHLSGDDAGFANYASCTILGLVAEFERLIVEQGELPDGAAENHDDTRKFLTWGLIWQYLFAPISSTRTF